MRDRLLILLFGLMLIHAQSGSFLTPLYSYTFNKPIRSADEKNMKFERPDGSCIPSGDHTSIQSALTDVGSEAVLCPDAVFELSETIYFTADNQSIYTEGFPTDSTRAFLKIVHKDVASAVRAGNNSGVTLSNVIIDGNRPELGVAMGALIEFISAGSGNMVEWVKAYEPRGWSVLYLGEGDDLLCDSAVARYNELGPGGQTEYAIADGISLACPNSIVEHNTIVDVTDGGIVIFQAPGSLVANNTIRAENRVMFYGISMEDIGPWNGDFNGTRVTGNVIEADGAMIRRGIGMGPYVGCIPDGEMDFRSSGAVVTDNILKGDQMAYGFVMSGVENWTATGNIDSSTHLVPDWEQGCFEDIVDPPGGFQLNPQTTSGTFQPEFEAAVLGFTWNWWPTQALASEACLESLIGSDVLDEIRDGLRGPQMEALENAPNGELIGQCMSIYELPDISDLSGQVIFDILPCEPYCAEVKIWNPSPIDSVVIERGEFLMELFLVDCPGLPAKLGPEEEARCIVDDFVTDGFQVLRFYGFPPSPSEIGFTYPFETLTVPPDDIRPSLPRSFRLSQNRPNPFNPSTTIEYSIPEGEGAWVHLGVYDLRGRLTRTLIDEEKGPGHFAAHWNGKDNQGREVSSGLYLYRFEAGGFTLIRKMMILR